MEYYVLLNRDQQRGPFSKEELLTAGLEPTSLVWRAGLTAWTPAQQLPELVTIHPPVQSPPPPPVDQLPPPLSAVISDQDLISQAAQESSDRPATGGQKRGKVVFLIFSSLVLVVLGIVVFRDYESIFSLSSKNKKPDLLTLKGVKQNLLGDWCLATSIEVEAFTFKPDGTFTQRQADPRASRWASMDSGHWEIKEAKFMDTRRSFYYIKAGINFFAFREGYPNELIDITFKGFNNSELEEDQYGIALEEYKITMAHSYDIYQAGTCGIYE